MKKALFIIHYSLFIFTVHAAEAPKTITAPKIEYNVKSESIKTTGRTDVSTAAGQRLTLTDSYISKTAGDVAARDIELWLGKNVYMSADSIKRTNDVAVARHADFTACYGCDDFGNAWEVSATTAKHDNAEHMMAFYNPVFWVYGVPVAWFPYLEWPDPSVKHKSGILMPDINSTNNMGTQINLPVYLSFSDRHDATITLSYLTAENPLVGLEHRLNADHSQFRTVGSFTRNREDTNRWHIFNDDIIEMGENLRGTIYIERASDKTYLQKYGFYGDQPYLDSGAKLEMFGQSGYAVADAHIFQELRDAIGNQTAPGGDILPNIRGRLQTGPLFADTFMTFDADVLGISGDGAASQRAIGDVRVVSPWTLGASRITASLSARYDVYNFSNTLMLDGSEFSGIKSRFLPSAYLEWAMPFAKYGDDWTQVFQPRARITAMKHVGDAAFAMNNDSAGALLSDTTLFSDNRFSGLDLWENGTFADYGVSWTAFNSDGKKIELFAGQTYDFANDDKETDPNSGFRNGGSDYVASATFDTGDTFSITSRARFARDNMNLRHIETDAHFGRGRNYFMVGHIFAAQFLDADTQDKNINEVIGGFSVYFTQRIGFKWDAVYNITDNGFQRHNGGVYYDHPCYYLALTYRRDNAAREDYVGNTTFQFRFGMNLNGIN